VLDNFDDFVTRLRASTISRETHDNDNKRNGLEFPRRIRMEQQPIYQSPQIEGTLNHIKLTLTKLKQTQHQTPNLSKAERKALISLKNNKDLVINSADKGSTIVAQDRSNYIKKN